jgi:RNA polymerase sigma-70 factor (ECF subfamily)
MAKLDDEDRLLVEGCLKNNRVIQEKLYRKYAPEMLRICRSYEPDSDSAKEILQNSFVKVFRNIKQFEGNGSLHAWIRRIVTNCAIDYFRKKQAERNMVSIDDYQVQELPAAEEFDADDYDSIIKAVALLPDGARHVFNLYALEGMTHKDIAQMMNVSEGTSKSQLNRARSLLKKYLADLNL